MLNVNPTVYVVIGPAGSGKSTVGRRIAGRHGAAYLDKDTLVTGFTELLLETNGFPRSDRDHNAYYQSVLLPLEYEPCWGSAGTTCRWVRRSSWTRRSAGTSPMRTT